ncbi:MAG: L,D-transpeptidase family protein [archaeon]
MDEVQKNELKNDITNDVVSKIKEELRGIAAVATNDQKKKKASFGTKLLIAGGVVAGATYYAGQKVWKYFYPPSLKRYLAVGMLFTTVVCVKNCDKASKDAFSAYSHVRDAIVRRVDGTSKMNSLEKTVHDGNKKFEQLQSYLKQKDGLILWKDDAFRKKDDELKNALDKYKGLEQRINQGRANDGPVVKNDVSSTASYSQNVSQEQPSFVKKAKITNPGPSNKPATIARLEGLLDAGEYSNIIYVDKQNNSLSLYKASGDGFELEHRYRCTTGTNPEPKEREGDKATPEGIYFINRVNLSPNGPLFGVGYLGLDYPNADDRREGRTGSGMLICGTDISDRMQAIMNGGNSTNMGVSLINGDFLGLYNSISDLHKTMVVIENSTRPFNINR